MKIWTLLQAGLGAALLSLTVSASAAPAPEKEAPPPGGTYTQNEIVNRAANFFGGATEGLARAVERVFSEKGFEVTTVDSGFSCLEHFRARPHWFDLILLDLSMPFMDGEETFRRMLAINPAVVVLLSSGFMAQAHGRIDRMLSAGLAGFIRKPHRPDELLAQVQAIIDRSKVTRAGCA